MANPGRRAVFDAIGIAALAFVIAVVAGVAFLVPLLALGYDVQTTPILLGATVAGQLGMFIAGHVYARRRGLFIPVSFPSRSALRPIVGGVIAALVVAIAFSLALSALDLLPGSAIADPVAADPTFLLGLAALSILVVAPVEEFVFRGVIQGRLRDSFGPAPAIAGASLLFGSMHLANFSGRLVPVLAGALLIAAVGAVFGALYERTGDLGVPIAVHATYNVILLGTSYLTV